MSDRPDLSVVIGFKDWGLNRLRLAIATIIESFGSVKGEVIVSDYGSSNQDARRIAEAAGARYVYTETDGVWSRSRALNAGFARSSGRILISTDADMIFSPETMITVARLASQDRDAAFLLQCRDLPAEWGDVDIAEKGKDWDIFERVARRRPRWGMGGMIAVSREKFLEVRGYDERMQTYGGEDIDFASRIRRVGGRLIWIEDPSVRMYHMWHPSTAAVHSRSAADSADVAANKRIMREDKTFVRNVRSWKHRPPDAAPLVSVVIATHNRAHLLKDTIYSLQAQTVQDFEIVIVDDGSIDGTRELVAGFGDARIRYVWQENVGVAAARNRGVDLSVGHYVAVMDDDDIALPWRLQAHFDALTEGVHATFGSFANFDDVTGEISIYRSKVFTEETTADQGGAPGHSTWLVKRELMSALRYDETLKSGIDNNFALRSLRSGVVWRHTGQVHSLRRMHASQITSSQADSQAAAARESYEFFTFLAAPKTLSSLRKERGSRDYVAPVGADATDLVAFLPDHLVTRNVIGEVTGDPQNGDIVCQEVGGSTRTFASKQNVSWAELAEHRGRLAGAQISASLHGSDQVPDTSSDSFEQVLELIRGEAETAREPGLFEVELLQTGQGVMNPDSHTWIERVVEVSRADRRRRLLMGSVEAGLSSLGVIEELSDAGGVLKLRGAPKSIDQVCGALLAMGSQGVMK